MSVLRYHVVPQDIQCADCHEVVRKMATPDPRPNETGDAVLTPARCQGCGNTGLIHFPIYTARPLPEEPPK